MKKLLGISMAAILFTILIGNKNRILYEVFPIHGAMPTYGEYGTIGEKRVLRPWIKKLLRWRPSRKKAKEV